MRPKKEGQVVRYQTPYPNEDPNQLFVVTEMKDGADLPRADIIELHSKFGWPSIYTRSLVELEVVKVATDELIGYPVTINKSNSIKVSGKVIKVKQPMLYLNLTKVAKGVETNVWLTILDINGVKHSGYLFIDMFSELHKSIKPI